MRSMMPLLALLFIGGSGAARALGDIGDDRAVEPLTQALDDRYRGVRDCASYALQKIRKQYNSL